MTDTVNDANTESDSDQHGGGAPQFDHFEVVEHLNLSDDAVDEIEDQLTTLSLIEDHTYGGYILAKFHEGEQ